MSDGSDTVNSRSQIVQVLTWFLFIIALLSVCARIGSKYAMTRGLGWDDRLILLAQAVYLAQCIILSTAASRGLGRASTALTGGMIDDILKADYASTPLLILTLALVKWSLCAFVQHITPDSSHLRINSWLLVLAGLWAASAIIVSLFQCALPTPWYYIDIERCVDRRAWWAYVAVLNMATEIGTVVLYFLMFWNLPISHSRKALVLTVFSSRTLLVAAIAVQLVAFRGAYPSPDIMATLWLPVIYDQVVICLSVATACMPYLKPFMEKLEADVVRVENFGLRRRVIWE